MALWGGGILEDYDSEKNKIANEYKNLYDFINKHIQDNSWYNVSFRATKIFNKIYLDDFKIIKE